MVTWYLLDVRGVMGAFTAWQRGYINSLLLHVDEQASASINKIRVTLPLFYQSEQEGLAYPVAFNSCN